MSKKLFLISAVIVFLIGLIGGAYLVLQSTVTRGELTNSTPISQGKSSDELLNELLKLNELEQSGATAEYIPPEDKNLTDDFLNTVVTKVTDSGGLSQKTVEEVSSNDFIAGTILPYLGENQINLFPDIPDSSLKIIGVSAKNRAAYFSQTNKSAVSLFYALKELIGINMDDVDAGENDVLAKLEDQKIKVSTAFENLSFVNVPQDLAETHKKLLTSAYSLQKTFESLINNNEDPLKTLVIFNDLETLGNFWKETLIEYDKASRLKK